LTINIEWTMKQQYAPYKG